jgi:hypothetical protein
MSTSRQIQSIRAIEQRCPADLLRNGRIFRRGCRVQSAAVRRLREMRKTAPANHQAQSRSWILRLHRVGFFNGEPE